MMSPALYSTSFPLLSKPLPGVPQMSFQNLLAQMTSKRVNIETVVTPKAEKVSEIEQCSSSIVELRKRAREHEDRICTDV